MSEEQVKNEMMVNEFSLSSGKKIYLREPRVGDNEVAAEIAGKIADPRNAIHTGLLVQKEMLKLLLVKINEKVLSMTDKEMIGSLLTYREYNQALFAVQKVTGDTLEGNLEMKLVSFGSK